MQGWLKMWCFVLLTLCCCSEALKPMRVHEGREDVHNEFPFVVSLQNWGRICTGSLIARNWVLTAGHCISGGRLRIKYKNFTTRGLSDKGAFAKVLNIILHPAFSRLSLQGSLFNDMALIRTTPIKNKTIGMLSAIDYKALTGLAVKYAGFGRTAHDSHEVLEDDKYRPLQVGEAVVSLPEPYLHYGPSIKIAPKCSQKEQGIRRGDSGGPLIYDGKIVGVAMASYSDTNIAWYAAVSPSLEWIRHTLNAYS